MSDQYDPQTGEIIVPVQLDQHAGTDLWTAFCAAQSKMEAPQKNKKADVQPREGRSYSFRYATLDTVIESCQEALNENGLVFTQAIVVRGNAYMLRTKIIHAASGQWFGNDYPVFVGRNDAQGFGGGTTYARRYGLMLALGVAAEEDDDANSSMGNRATISDTRQQDQRPPQQQRSYPAQQPTRPANGAADAARAVVNRVKAAIESATTIEQLNKAYTEADRQSVVAQNKPNNPIGDKVWEQLMNREADKRLQLVGEAELDKYEAGGGEDDFMSEEESRDVFAR